jgi:uncharacterized repeat protein (TIGR01451 family)
MIFPGGTALAAGTNILPVVVPASAVPGQAAARLRCTTDGEVGFAGEASDGEVEDLLVTVGSPELAATKTASLDDDADGDGVASGGDTLLYSVVVVNDGTAAATGVAFTDTPDPATTLVPGSVTTTAGTVTTGNGAGDSSVAVDVGTLAAGGGSVTITYAVVINDPVPNGVDEVVNQGTVTSDAQGPVLTDDPSPPGGEDPTVVSVVGAAVVEIPALGAWGAGLLLALLAGLGLRRLARA